MRRVFFVLFILIVVLAGGGLAVRRADSANVPGRAELMVVFKGPGVPSREVFALLGQGVAMRFAIPGTPQETISSFTRKYGLPTDVEYIPAGERTESTFEDALQAGRVIRNGGYRDVLLVAADYHVPRARLLLWAESRGSGCRIRVMGIPGGWTTRQKAAHRYNEAVKFPGSLLEYAWYHLTGRLLTEYPRLNGYLEMVKGWVLVGEEG